MRLKKVILNNFRCFGELELDLHPRLTVLVAENGGGKTAILDGIAIGLSPVLRYLSSADQRLSGPGINDTDFRLVDVRGAKGKSRLVTSAYTQILMETTDGIKWDNARSSAKGRLPLFKRVRQSHLAEYASGLLDSLKTPKPGVLPAFAYYGARRGWIIIPERLRGSKVDYAQPTSALYGSLEASTDFKELVNWFYLEDAAEARSMVGGEPGEQEEFVTLEAVRVAISAILGGIYKEPHFNKQHKLVIKAQSGPSVLQVSQLSQGYQSMLALGMDFARRLALANGHLTHEDINPIFVKNLQCFHPAAGDSSSWVSPSLLVPAIMLVDEIDLHLHPSWQQRVLDDLMRAFPCTQFIVTTHSPQVLTTVHKECIRILEMKNGAPVIRVPTYETYAQESRATLEDVLDTPSRPPLDITQKLQKYLQGIEDGQDESPEMHQLRAELETIMGAGDSQLQLADMLIARNQAKKKAKA